MKEIEVYVKGLDIDFEKAKAVVNALVKGEIVAWSDGVRNYPDVCCECGGKPGWMTYGETRGNVKIKINKFVFYVLSDEEAER